MNSYMCSIVSHHATNRFSTPSLNLVLSLAIVHAELIQELQNETHSSFSLILSIKHLRKPRTGELKTRSQERYLQAHFRNAVNLGSISYSGTYASDAICILVVKPCNSAFLKAL